MIPDARTNACCWALMTHVCPEEVSGLFSPLCRQQQFGTSDAAESAVVIVASELHQMNREMRQQ